MSTIITFRKTNEFLMYNRVKCSNHVLYRLLCTVHMENEHVDRTARRAMIDMSYDSHVSEL